MYPLLLFAALFQAADPAEYRVLAACSDNDHVLAMIGVDEAVRVRYAIAGDSQPCYAVAANVSGKPVAGSVLGGSTPALLAFDRERRAGRTVMPPALAGLVEAGGVPAPAENAVAEAPGPVFESFSAKDAMGKSFSFADLHGKAVLVCFWSPQAKASENELRSAAALYDELHASGLDAVGISLDINTGRILGALDETGVTWPQVPDRQGLAAKYNISRDQPTILLLDQDRRIRAIGLHGSELSEAVRKLLQ